MLKLIQCEFMKLKRKKFIQLVIVAAFLFPIPMTFLMTTPVMLESYNSKVDAFDGLWDLVVGYGIQFLLPCMIGIISSMLFFMERDNGTFKNLLTVPITSKQMIFAKISVLFILSIIFCIASTTVTIICGMATLEVTGIMYKMWLSVEMGVFITAGTLPLVVIVVFFSRNYIFSVLLCAFYSILNMCATFLYDVLPKGLLLLLPTPLTSLWSAGNMVRHGIQMDLSGLSNLIPSTLHVMVTLGIMALLSITLIVYLYKKSEG